MARSADNGGRLERQGARAARASLFELAGLRHAAARQRAGVGDQSEHHGRERRYPGGEESGLPGAAKKRVLLPPGGGRPGNPGHAAPRPHRARPSVRRT